MQNKGSEVVLKKWTLRIKQDKGERERQNKRDRTREKERDRERRDRESVLQGGWGVGSNLLSASPHKMDSGH